MSTPKLKVGVLGSTRGTALQGVLDAIDAGTLQAEIVLVLSDREAAGILDRANAHHIPARFISAKGRVREEYEREVTAAFEQAGAELILMIGFMRIVTEVFVNAWRGRLLNVHPSLLPLFAGGMNLDVHRAVLESGAAETGCTIHQVTEAVDAGPILLQKRCPVLPDDTTDTLKERVQALEQQGFVEVLQSWRER
ncbi:MAG: phosphoribosylglycinamide formyltransferase [Acidobacteriaceae bacterium]|nr:phosphoribosylglycinamide formyltransferase [Acidobacteriaceae bacterium]